MAMHHNLRLVQGALVALCLSLFTNYAFADSRVVVRSFPGPSGDAVRRSVVKELGRHDGVTIVPNEAVDRAAKRRGVRADGPIGRREIGRELEVGTWVEGHMRRKAGKLELSLVVRGGSGNAELASFTAMRKKPKQLDAAIRSKLWKEVGSSITSTPAPESDYQGSDDASEGAEGDEAEAEEPAMPVPVAQSSDSETPPFVVPTGTGEEHIDGDVDEPKGKRTVSAVQAAFTMNTLHRTLHFNDAFTQGIADYTLAAAPMADLSARIYPGAFLSDGWASYIGLDLRGQMAFALKSEGADKVQYPTHYDSYGAGLVGRYPMKQHEVNALVGYGAQRFRVDNAGGQTAPVPDVDYRSLRFGLGGKVALMQRFKLGMEAAWLLISSTGELANKEWFPQAKGNAIEGTLYADITLIGALDARARVSYQRAYFDFNSKVGDTRVAGGAADDYISGGLGLAYAY